MEEKLHPAYIQGLTASNRLTDARTEVWNLLDVLPMRKQVTIVNLYNQLCHVQGTLENLLKDIPTTVRVEKETDNGR